MSDIKGKAARVAASEYGQRVSFNGANGMNDIEGKVTRVGARMEPRGREQHRWENREVEMGGST
jgi:hypothetical protein